MRDTAFGGVTTDRDFVPAKSTSFTKEIYEALFGRDPDATLLDYRFFQFLCLIGSCGLRQHVIRVDSRETYAWEDFAYVIDKLFISTVQPQVLVTEDRHAITATENGLQLITLANEPESDYDRIRTELDISYVFGQLAPIAKAVSYEQAIITLPVVWSSAYSIWNIQNTKIGLRISTEGRWLVDYRRKPRQSIIEIIDRTLALSPSVYQQLFAFIADDAPSDYAEGFTHITDVIHKFCMVLFGLACAHEKICTVK
jgi:hypothetical protein